MELNVVWLYPDIMNLHGDRGNMMALAEVCRAMGVKFVLHRCNHASELPDLHQVDFIYIGPGAMRNMKPIAEDLKTKNYALKDYIENDGHFLAIGSSGCLLAKKFSRRNGEEGEGLGIFDMTAKELHRTKMPFVTPEVYGDDLFFKTRDGMELIGCQIQCVDYTLLSGEAFGEVLYGYGNNTTDGKEGAVYKNTVFTNLVAPLFPTNPWLAVKMVREIAAHKGCSLETFNESDISFMNYAEESKKLKIQFIKDKAKLSGILCRVS